MTELTGMKDFENVLLEANDGIATLTINRPKSLNALNSDTLVEIGEALDVVKNNEDAI